MFISLNYIELISFLYLILALVITISYVFCYNRFKNKIFNENKRFTKKEKKSLNFFNLTFKVLLFSRVVGIISGILGLYGASVYRTHVEHGTLNYARVLLDVGLTTCCVELTMISYYCHKITVRLLKIKRSVSSIHYQ